MTYPSFLLPLFYFLTLESCSNSEVNNVNFTLPVSKNQIKKTITIINRNSKEVLFWYRDVYENPVQVKLRPDSVFKIITQDDFNLFEASKSQGLFLLHPGDSLYATITSQGIIKLIPFHSVNKYSIEEVNFFQKMNNYIQPIFWDLYIFSLNNFEREYSLLNNVYTKLYQRQRNYLDSLLLNNIISNDFHQIADDILKTRMYTWQLEYMGVKRTAPIKNEYWEYLDSLGRKIELAKDNIFKNDAMLLYWKMKAQRETGIRYSGDFSKEDQGFKYNNGSLLYNYINRYSSNTSAEFALFKVIKSQLEVFKTQDTSILNNFLKRCKNENYLNYISNIIELKNNTQAFSGKDYALTVDKRRIRYDSLINTLKGKVLFIDFWASWCMPCRAEMPASALLREKYKQKPIVFHYLSTDENILNWLKASEKDNIDENNSFLILDFEKSTINKAYKISSIPRYILVNKKGKVVDLDALKPSNPELIKILDRLIAEK